MRKVCIGHAHRFQWWPPNPNEMQLTDPTLTVYWESGAETYAMPFAEYAEASAISEDRLTLTVTWSGDAWTMGEGSPVAAQLIASELGTVPIRVIRLSDDYEVVLESPLPDEITVVGAVLRGLVCSVDIPALDVPAAAVRPVRWTVSYSAIVSGGTAITKLDFGTLAVVLHPFSTGLTDAELIRIAGWTRTAAPSGQTGLIDVITSSLDTLIGHIRARRPDIYEDALDGGQFLRAHAILAQLALMDDLIAKGQDRTGARDRLAAELDAELARVFAALVWVDSDADGDSDTTQPSSTTVGGIGIADSTYADTTADEDAQPITIERWGMGDPR